MRNINNRKLFSLINILGLAMGIASCLVILFWVEDELNYDRFHNHADRIYRLERKWDFRDMHGQAPMASALWGPAMKKDYPEIEAFVRLEKSELSVKDFRNIFYKQHLFIADNSIFSLFNFPLKKGDASTALTEPYTIVLTDELSRKYTGTMNSIGKIITIEWQGKPRDFLVTGILQKVPQHSHFKFDMLVSISSYPKDYLNQWLGGNALYTYVLLAKNVNHQDFEKKMPGFLKKYMEAEFAAYFGASEDINQVFQIKLKPLLDIHLNPARYFEIAPQGSINAIYIFSIIAALVLIIASINFMNLSTATASRRAMEVGIRKTIGAKKGQLLKQFMGESFILTLLAMILSMSILNLFLPVFNELSGKTFTVMLIFEGQNILKLVLITFITGIFAGLYPAFYLTAFKPVNSLKGTVRSGKGKSVYRIGLVTFQFGISIGLVICSLIIFKQMSYMQNRSMGFEKENLLIISAEKNTIIKNIEAFRNSLKEVADVESFTPSSNVPGDKVYADTNFKRADTGDAFNFTFIHTGYDFLRTYKVELLGGRWFSKEFSTDLKNAFVLNEKAIKDLGWKRDEAIGKKIIMTVGENKFRESIIIGVVRDFNLQSLHSRIEPLAILLGENDFIRYITLRLKSTNINNTLKTIQKKWEAVFPGQQFEYSFLDSKINLRYKGDIIRRDIVLIFSILSILIACAGLLGLATYSAEDRTKEIGIRKVLGASSKSIVVLLSKEFATCVVIAIVLAWPAAYFFMQRWLMGFAFRTSMGIASFVIAGIFAFLIAQLTVVFQSLKAAWANPVDSIRYE
jgi:putative ABC transport system permease protein